jgi:hypothetical protein
MQYAVCVGAIRDRVIILRLMDVMSQDKWRVSTHTTTDGLEWRGERVHVFRT